MPSIFRPGLFEGQVAIVTGGGSGIGLACARRLLRDGASVTIAGRTESKLQGAAAELEREAPAGAIVRFIPCDVADEAAVQAAIAHAREATGRLDIAVANAGTGAGGPIFSTTGEMFRLVLDVNVLGTFFTIKHAGLAMRAGGGGSIIAISSIASPLTHRFMATYCTSKAAIDALVRNAADELGVLGIRVNSVQPGLVPTDLAGPLVQAPGVEKDYLSCMPLGRLGTPEDIANGVRYLAGPESAWVTGQCFAIDGGHTLRRGPNVDAMAKLFFGEEAVAGLTVDDD